MNAALFNVRSLKKFSNTDDNETLSFFMGVMMAPEIDNIINSTAQSIAICGKNQLKQPIAALLSMNCQKQIEIIPDDVTENATAYGAVRVYEASLNK
jgi:2-keto-3-deoxy-galactonokinase